MTRLLLIFLLLPSIACAAPWWETAPGGAATTVNDANRLIIEQNGSGKTITRGLLLDGMATDAEASAAAANAVSAHNATFNHSLLHSHSNKSVIDRITESGNLPLWDGQPWPGSSVTWDDVTGKPATFAPATHNNTAHSETYLTAESDPGVATHESTYDHTDMSGVNVTALEKIGESAGLPTWNGGVWPGGEGGGGVGDMLRSVYDQNLNGIVDTVDTIPGHASSHATAGSDPLTPGQIGAATTGHLHTGTYDPAGTAATAVSTHTGLADPHTGYMLESNIGTTAGKYIVLDGSGRLPAVDGSQLTGVGTGDMLRSAYDTDLDGAVDMAESVPWAGVTSKPSTFAPSAHKSSHATGGSDALTAADVGAATSIHLHTGVYDPAGTAAAGDAAHLAASDPHTQYVKASELTVQDLLSFGMTFHFRSDAPICDTNHVNHATALSTVNALGVGSNYIVCDEFATSVTAANLTGAGMTIAAGTLGISGNVLQTLAGVGMTSAAGAITVAASDPDTLIVNLGGVAGTSEAGTLAISGGGVAELAGVAMTGSAGTLTISGTGDVTVTIDGVAMTASAGTISVPADTTPDAFSFTDVTDATTSTLYTSDAITVAGMDAGQTTTVVLTGDGTNNAYEKNTSGSWVTANGTAVAGDTFRVRHTSSGSAATATTSILTIGGTSDTYTVTTAAAGGTTVSDNFNRADGGLGDDWTTFSGTPTISSNRVTNTQAGTIALVTHDAVVANNQYAQTHVDSNSGIQVNPGGVIVRASVNDTTLERYEAVFLYYFDGGVNEDEFYQRVVLRKVLTTGSTAINTVDVDSTHKYVKLEASGTSLVVRTSSNGTNWTNPVISTTDSSLSSGSIGIRVLGGDAVGFVDDFSGGDL